MTGFSATQAVGRIAASEADKVYVPQGWRYDASKRVVIWCHGAAADYRLGPVERIIRDALDVPWIACDMGGQSEWGSDLAVQTRFDSAWAWAKTNLNVKADKYLIWGGSMGSLTGLLRVLYDPTHVAALGAALAIVDPEQIRAANAGGYAAAIQAIHGNPVPDGKRPNQNNAAYISGAVPLWLAISETDTVGDATLAHSFVTAVGASSVSLGSVGHSYLALDTAAAIAFLGAHL